MKNVMLAVFFVVISCSFVFAEEVKKESFEVTFSSKVFSRYVDDVAFVSYKKPVLQNDLTISHESGVYVNIWTSTSIEDTGVNTNYGNEVDCTIGWNGEISGVGLDMGVSYFDILKLFKMPDNDIVQPYIEISKKIEITKTDTITPSIKVTYGIPAKGSSKEEKGGYLYFNLHHEYSISEKISINQKAVIVYDDGAYGLDSALVGSYEINPSWKISENLSIDGGIKAITPLSNVDDGRKTEIVFSGGINFLF